VYAGWVGVGMCKGMCVRKVCVCKVSVRTCACRVAKRRARDPHFDQLGVHGFDFLLDGSISILHLVDLLSCSALRAPRTRVFEDAVVRARAIAVALCAAGVSDACGMRTSITSSSVSPDSIISSSRSFAFNTADEECVRARPR